MPESNIWSGRSSCDLRCGSIEADRELVISGDNLDNFVHVDASKSKNNVDNFSNIDASKSIKALGRPANRKTFDLDLPKEKEENGRKDSLPVDGDFRLSNEQKEIICVPTDVSEDKDAGDWDEVGEISTGNEVGDISEQNDGGQSREQRQSDSLVRLERLTEVEVSERLGEVETIKVEVGEGVQEVDVGERLGEMERETLKDWLQDFSAHTHLPRAYQVKMMQNNCISKYLDLKECSRFLSFKIILQVNHFKVRPPDQNEVKAAKEKAEPIPQPKAKNPKNIKLKPVDVQIEHQNSEIGYSGRQIDGENDHHQLVVEIIDETVNKDEKSEPLLLDPHTKVAAQDVLKVWSSHYPYSTLIILSIISVISIGIDWTICANNRLLIIIIRLTICWRVV